MMARKSIIDSGYVVIVMLYAGHVRTHMHTHKQHVNVFVHNKGDLLTRSFGADIKQRTAKMMTMSSRQWQRATKMRFNIEILYDINM